MRYEPLKKAKLAHSGWESDPQEEACNERREEEVGSHGVLAFPSNVGRPEERFEQVHETEKDLQMGYTDSELSLSRSSLLQQVTDLMSTRLEDDTAAKLPSTCFWSEPTSRMMPQNT